MRTAPVAAGDQQPSSSTSPGAPSPSSTRESSALTRTGPRSPAATNQAPGNGERPRIWRSTSAGGLAPVDARFPRRGSSWRRSTPSAGCGVSTARSRPRLRQRRDQQPRAGLARGGRAACRRYPARRSARRARPASAPRRGPRSSASPPRRSPVAGHDRPLDRRRAAPARQQRGVQVEARRGAAPRGPPRGRIWPNATTTAASRSRAREGGDLFRCAHRGRRADLDAVRLGEGLNRRGRQRLAAAARRRRLGIDARDLVPRLDEGGEAGDREVGGAEEGEAHGAESFSVGRRRPKSRRDDPPRRGGGTATPQAAWWRVRGRAPALYDRPLHQLFASLREARMVPFPCCAGGGVDRNGSSTSQRGRGTRDAKRRGGGGEAARRRYAARP